MQLQRKQCQKAVSEFENKWRQREDYLENPQVLAEALADYEHLHHFGGLADKEAYYFGLRTAQDQSDPKLKAAENKVTDFSLMLWNRLQFFELKIAKISRELQPNFLSAEDLAPFRHYLERLFARAQFQLSESEERIMNLKAQPAHTKWTSMVSEFVDRQEREVTDEYGVRKLATLEELLGLINSQQKSVRDEAAKALNDILDSHTDVAEHEMNAVLLNKKIDDELRGFTRPDAQRHLSDDVDPEFVDALIKAVSKRNDIAHRYYHLKARLMGQDKLEYHERNVEYGKVDKPYSYHDSVELLEKVFSSLDPEFGDIFHNFVQGGRIDVYPQKNKATGAFCAGSHSKIVPTYVLLNHTNKLRDVETFAHEMGHAINNELMRGKQNHLNFSLPMATAEVASTFMEDFANQELLAQADDELKLSLIMQKLNGDVSTIFRQISCYQLEQDLHQRYREQGYLPKSDIGEIFQKHMSNYMGSAVEQSAGSENWWVYWGHLRYFFYVYSYASGLLISKALQAKVKQDKSFISEVKEFLAAGRSDSPRNLFAKMGIDINDSGFWDQGLDEVEQLLQEAEQLADKLGKL